MTGSEFDRWLDTVMRPPAAAPSRDLLERVLAIPHTHVDDSRFDFFSLFNGWQTALAGGAICASLLAGLIVGGASPTGMATDDPLWETDIPGLTYSPGELEDWS